MKVIPIGTNGLYPTPDSPTSCYLVEVNGKTVLLDIGSGAFTALSRFIAPEKIDVVIISHFHLDHCADIGVFGYYMQNKREKIKLFCPNDERALKFFSLEKFFDVSLIKAGKADPDGFGGAAVTFIKTAHPVPTFATKIAFGGRTLAYTADTNASSACDDIFSGSDLVVCDSAFLDADWSPASPHLSAKLCGGYSFKYGVKTLLTHIAPSVDKNSVLKEANAVSPLCELIVNDKEYAV